MDAAVRNVLDIYDARLREEQRQRETGMGMQDLDRLLLAVGPDTGQLINLLARSQVRPTILELGTSYGYSTIWLAEAAKATGGRVVTMELQGYKAGHAKEMAQQAGLASVIDFQVGDALKLLEQTSLRFDFVLVDLWKDLYEPCLDRFHPKLNAGAIIVSDNMIRPGGPVAQSYRRALLRKPGITSVLLPVGSGIEVSRYGVD
ncbi:MAG TPA: DUF1442 domain-containing protein [Candidatus Aquabacterium excrementipullorum]|nr:DUF1442 domain-containing protein [Candidatus Aquabacterium excrementipullorum]